MDETVLRSEPCCYRSSPEHVTSFVGQLIWIYTDKGSLALTPQALLYDGKKTGHLRVPLDAIQDVYTGHYSRLAKPFRLEYMGIRYADGPFERTVLLTPTKSWATPVWTTNTIVAEWVEAIQVARAAVAAG
jgi:hypothetical protein